MQIRNDNIQLFEDQPIRTAWVEDEEEWYFSIVDVVGALTEQPDLDGSKNYWKVLNMQLTLIPILSNAWNKSYDELLDIFKKYDVLSYIDVCYENILCYFSAFVYYRIICHNTLIRVQTTLLQALYVRI